MVHKEHATSFMDTFHAWVTLGSLGLTWPALIVSMMVLVSWHSKYKLYLFEHKRTPSYVLIAGVYLSFVGFFMDSSWWGIAWSLDYLLPEDPDIIAACRAGVENTVGCGVVEGRDFFFHYGVFSNIAFRQSLGLWAGLLHVHAESLTRETKMPDSNSRVRNRRIIYASFVIAAVYTLLLVLLKSS